MATKFRISVHRNSDSLHLKLIGDFEVTSVQDLVNILRENLNGACRVFIHTNCLKEINPDAFAVLSSQLNAFKGQIKRVTLTGEHADKIAI